MKKLLTVAAISLATAGTSTAMANDSMFVGVEFGKAKTNVEIKHYEAGVFESAEDKNVKPSQYGIRVGQYLNKNVRVYANLNQSKKKAFQDENGDVKLTNRQLTVSADYVFDMGHQVKPFAGATVGTNWSEFKDTSVDVDKTKSKYALAYGLQAGIVGQFGDFDVELGYRYLKHKNEVKMNNRVENEYQKMVAKNSRTPYLSVSYKF